MNKKIIAILLIISIVTISGCAQKKPIEPNPTTPVTEPSIKSCSIPSDCGSFYDCINSKCVKIMPPVLP